MSYAQTLPPLNRRVATAEIVTATARAYGIPVATFFDGFPRGRNGEARKAVYWLATAGLDRTATYAARELGRDRSTVSEAARDAEQMIATRDAFRSMIDAIWAALSGLETPAALVRSPPSDAVSSMAPRGCEIVSGLWTREALDRMNAQFLERLAAEHGDLRRAA